MGILERLWPYALAVVVVIGALYGAYDHGVTVTNDKWARADSDRQLFQAKGLAEETAKARGTEQDWQSHSNQVGKDARAQIAAAAADGIVADAAGDSVRDAANKLAATADNVSCDTGAIRRGAAATRAAGVFSDMLQRADKRAGVLAKIADNSRIAGEACAREYDYLKSTQSTKQAGL
jgi:hypothetical protein